MSSVLVLGPRPGNIGEAISHRLEQEGYECFSTDCSVDLGDHTAYQAPPQRWIDEKGADHMVCTLGAMHIEPFTSVAEEMIGDVIWGSLILPLVCARRFIESVWNHPHFDGDEAHKIVFIGSYAQDHALSNSAAYCAAKAGLNAAVKELAWELTDQNFFVHVVNPYHVPNTPMGEEVFKSMIRSGMTALEVMDKQSQDLKMPGHLTSLEIAEMVSLIISESAMDWTAGTPINMYGGTR